MKFSSWCISRSSQEKEETPPKKRKERKEKNSKAKVYYQFKDDIQK